MLWLPHGDRLLVPASGLVGQGMGALGRFTEPSSVPRDGPGNWYLPETAAHFTALGLEPPDYWALLGDAASGDITPRIDTLGLGNLVAGSTPIYQQSVSGWTALAGGLNSAGDNFHTSLSLSSGESVAALAYVYPSSGAGAQNDLFAVTYTANRVQITNLGIVRAVVNGGGGTAGTVDHRGAVRQIVWRRDATANVSGLVTNLETTAATHNEGAASGALGPGPGTAINTEVSNFIAFGLWKGAHSEQDWAAYLTTLRGE